MKSACELAPFADTPCQGALVRCHLIPKQDLKRLWGSRDQGLRISYRNLEELQSDPRTWVWGCGGIMGDGGHHGQLDGRHHKRIVIPFSSLPAETVELAMALGLLWRLERNHPR